MWYILRRQMTVVASFCGLLHPVHTTNLLPEVHGGDCKGCGQCVNICPVEAMGMVSANDPRMPKKKKALLHEETCLGCGLCTKACPGNNITLKSRYQRVITPLNSVHLAIVMAIDKGKLQNLIFDNQALFSHRAMAAILGVILKLSPVKQAMANHQMKSRYLETLIKRTNSNEKSIR
jgi:ferredoxin